MSVAAALILSDGLVVRVVHPAAMPEPLRAEIERFVATQVEDVSEPIPSPAKAPDPADYATRAEVKAAAVGQGFTGDSCRDCGSFAMKRAGTCLICQACGTTTGCS